MITLRKDRGLPTELLQHLHKIHNHLVFKNCTSILDDSCQSSNEHMFHFHGWWARWDTTYLRGTSEAISTLTNRDVEDQLLNLDLTHRVLLLLFGRLYHVSENIKTWSKGSSNRNLQTYNHKHQELGTSGMQKPKHATTLACVYFSHKPSNCKTNKLRESSTSCWHIMFLSNYTYQRRAPSSSRINNIVQANSGMKENRGTCNRF